MSLVEKLEAVIAYKNFNYVSLGGDAAQRMDITVDQGATVFEEQPQAVPSISIHDHLISWIPAGYDALRVYLLNASAFHAQRGIEARRRRGRYTVKDQLGQTVCYVVEDRQCCEYHCPVTLGGEPRPLNLKVIDTWTHTELLQLKQSSSCQNACYSLQLQDMQIITADGSRLLGSVVQQASFLKPDLHIKDISNNTVLKITGDILPRLRLGTSKFEILTQNDLEVGHITIERQGILGGIITNCIILSIHFPQDLNINVKALCLGALFLIVSLNIAS